MSLDGFAAGANVSMANPMGDGGGRLHDWLFNKPAAADRTITEEIVKRAGAVIVGGNTYHTAIDGVWEGVSPFTIPAVVITSTVPLPRQGFTFVAGGLEQAMQQAQELADNKDIWVMGGPRTVRAFLKAGLFDELILHIAPMLLAAGTRLFEGSMDGVKLQKESVTDTPHAMHVRFTRRT